MNNVQIRLLNDERPGSYFTYDTGQLSQTGYVPLVDSRLLGVDVPALGSWSTVATPEHLFRQLGIQAWCLPDGSLRLSARETWQGMFSDAAFGPVFAPLLERIDWYGANATEHASPRMTQMLAGRAITDHFLGATGAAHESMDRLLRRSWVVLHSHAQLDGLIRERIRARYPEAGPATLEMLRYLLVRESLPELLVQGVPDHLQYGRSLQSVALIHGTALSETVGGGASACATYDDLARVGTALAASQDPAIQALLTRTLVRPALLYGMAHGVIELTDDDIDKATAGHIEHALAYLKTAQDAHARELHDLLSLGTPDRQHLAEAMLRQAGLDEHAWTASMDKLAPQVVETLQAHGFSLAWSYPFDRLAAVGRPEATLLELVMMGEAWLAGQPTVPQAYDDAWQVYETALRSAEAAVIARLLAEMQPAQCEQLLQSTCEVSRIRFVDGEGTQGLLIRCRRGDRRADFHSPEAGEETFFELFPAAGVIRETTQRFNYFPEHHDIHSINLLELWRNHEANEQRDAQAPFMALEPFDSDAYLHGKVSRSAQRLHTPAAGMLVADPVLLYLPGVDAPAALASLASAAAGHLLAGFLKQNKLDHQHLSPWEQAWAREREWADTAARWLIPFYGCIKDLAAGNRSASVVTGCVLDAVFALLPMGLFVAATARLVLRAGEMTVLSLAREAGASLLRLAEGLAQQSAAFMLRDMARLASTASRAVVELLHDLPSLKNTFSAPVILDALVQEKLWFKARSPFESAMVDGRPAVAVVNAGREDKADFRLLDPFDGQAYGKRLTQVSQAGSLELSTQAARDTLVPGHYPDVAPLLQLGDGSYQLVAEGGRIVPIARPHGVADILIDAEIYRLDRYEPNPALRKAALQRLSPDTTLVQESVAGICRVRRDLIPVPCAKGVRLMTALPELSVQAGQQALQAGDHFSHAMAARAFDLDAVKARPGSVSPGLDVFVHENRLCKWQVPGEAGSSSTAQATGPAPAEVSEAERLAYGLPEQVAYRTQVSGQRVSKPGFGLSEQALGLDVGPFNQEAPVIRLGSIAEGIDDARTLRGIRLRYGRQDWIYIEPDRSVFYRAVEPADAAHDLAFSRVLAGDEGLDEYLMHSEQYRLVREIPSIWQDRQNIARMLFDMLDDTERASLPAGMTFDEYDLLCSASQQPNRFLEYATKALSGKSFQDAYIELARRAVPDFRVIGERSPAEVQSIVDVLNNLLPARPARKGWVTLSVDTIALPATSNRIRKQINGANLAFAVVYEQGRRRSVYFSLSGGELARTVRLQPEQPWTVDAYIDGVHYNDARPRPASLVDESEFTITHDPRFTTLPRVREVDRLSVRAVNRSLDSERLIGTMLKDELQDRAASITRIEFFTLLDACRSCGGFALPRLRHDFPQAQFSVTYLRPYKDD